MCVVRWVVHDVPETIQYYPSKHQKLLKRCHSIAPLTTWILSNINVRTSNPARPIMRLHIQTSHMFWHSTHAYARAHTNSHSPLKCRYLYQCNKRTRSMQNYYRHTLKNAWLRSPPSSLLYMLFWMIGLPPSSSALPNSTASTKMDGECTDLITSSTTKSDAPSRSRWHCTSCSVLQALLNILAGNLIQAH